ncbi:type IV toxin-antitoxin system AbiEi family antitoxin domain-containing protein [Candidatus Poriferisodalis sp.]|uniref:type IV toxin-antitoxin system AbiEi family antitoxin domain-containing protein n=1 Tax=Candidatus Poriferisodalis sp. TaxID=3101277 RepID=UPI003C6F675E
MAGSVIGRLGDVPAAQHGYFTRAQASAAGIPDFDLTRSVGRGLIERVGHGVYRVAGAGFDPLAELRIASFRLDPERTPRQRAADPRVWVALQSAARVHGFGVFAGGPHTFVSRGRIQPGHGTSVRRRSRGLERGDWELKDGFAVTTVSRTTADLMSDHVDGGHIGRFISDALNAGAISMVRLCERLGVDPDEIESLLMQSGEHASAGVND